MQLKENYKIWFVIHTAGKAAYETDEILSDGEVTASMKAFLHDFPFD